MNKDKKEREESKQEDLFSEDENIKNISIKDLLSGKIRLNTSEENKASKEEIDEMIKALMRPIEESKKRWKQPAENIQELAKRHDSIQQLFNSLKITDIGHIKDLSITTVIGDTLDKISKIAKERALKLKQEISRYGIEYRPYDIDMDIELLRQIKSIDEISNLLLAYIVNAFREHTKEYQQGTGDDLQIELELPDTETKLIEYVDLFNSLSVQKELDSEEVKEEIQEEEISREFEYYYRQSIELLNQERQSSETKLRLFKEADIDKSRLEDIGLELSDGEMQALHAVTKLLHKTRHRGHEVDLVRDPITRQRVPSPIIYTYLSEYYDAYELKKDKNGHYDRKQKRTAYKNLEALKKTQTIVGKKKISEKEVKTKKGKKIKKDVVRVVEMDVSLLRRTLIRDFTSEELEEKNIKLEDLSSIREDTDLSGKKTLLILQYDPFFTERIESFFTYLPYNLYQLAKEISVGKNEKVVRELLKMLHKHKGKINQDGYPELRRHYKNLAHTVGLDSDLKSRHYSRAIQKIEDGVSKLEDAGYLLSGSKYNTGTDMVTLVMNPEKLPRTGAFLKKRKKIEEQKTKKKKRGEKKS